MTKLQAESAREIRRCAEERVRLNQSATSKMLSSDDNDQLVFELQVHQIELEMQNNELQRTQVELEALRSRYFNLYDLAPVGYLTFNRKGLILEANLAAATMLQVSRSMLLKQPFNRFIFTYLLSAEE